MFVRLPLHVDEHAPICSWSWARLPTSALCHFTISTAPRLFMACKMRHHQTYSMDFLEIRLLRVLLGLPRDDKHPQEVARLHRLPLRAFQELGQGLRNRSLQIPRTNISSSNSSDPFHGKADSHGSHGYIEIAAKQGLVPTNPTNECQ